MQATAYEQAVHPSPPAVRLRRPGWRDPRLLIGVVLVAASVAGTSWLVSAAGRTMPVYAADGPLVAGEQLAVDALHVVDVRLDGAEMYVPADQPLPDGLVVVRTVGDGELVPWSAVADAAELEVRPVAVAPAGTMSSDVTEGSRVDLWFVPAVDAGTAGNRGGTAQAAPDEELTPYQLAAGLTVAEVSEPDGAFAVGAGITVHVLVPVPELAHVLAALGADGAVQVVPVPGTGRP